MDAPNFADNEAFHREAKRRSRDTVMVYNPTERDFTVEVNGEDGFNFVVKAKQKRELERWQGELFAKRMVVHLINELAEEKGRKEIAALAKKSITFKDKYEENFKVWNNQRIVPRTDDPKLTEYFWSQVFLGVVKEYGMEYAEDDLEQRQRDLDPIEKKLKELSNRPYIEEEAIEERVTKKELEEEVLVQ